MAEPPDFEPPVDDWVVQAMTKGWQPRPVTTAADAEVYARAVTSHMYGPEAARLQLPFHVQAVSGGWRVKGSLPWQGWAALYTSDLSGPLTIAFDRDGVIHNAFVTSDVIAPSLPAAP